MNVIDTTTAKELKFVAGINKISDLAELDKKLSYWASRKNDIRCEAIASRIEAVKASVEKTEGDDAEQLSIRRRNRKEAIDAKLAAKRELQSRRKEAYEAIPDLGPLELLYAHMAYMLAKKRTDPAGDRKVPFEKMRYGLEAIAGFHQVFGEIKEINGVTEWPKTGLIPVRATLFRELEAQTTLLLSAHSELDLTKLGHACKSVCYTREYGMPPKAPSGPMPLLSEDNDDLMPLVADQCFWAGNAALNALRSGGARSVIAPKSEWTLGTFIEASELEVVFGDADEGVDSSALDHLEFDEGALDNFGLTFNPNKRVGTAVVNLQPVEYEKVKPIHDNFVAWMLVLADYQYGAQYLSDIIAAQVEGTLEYIASNKKNLYI